MSRQSLTDGSGRWFDPDKGTKYAEETEWNGSNNISVATGSQWEHEALYRTASGCWILNHWSNYQGSRESYEEITDKAAAAWLIQNRHDPPAIVAGEAAALEV